MLCARDGALARRQVGGLPDRTRAPIFDELLIEALQPFDILQVGMAGQLLEHSVGTAVRSVGTLHDAISAMAQHEFDVIVLGSDVADAWPTAAYEEIARVAGTTPVLVHADVIGPMASIKQQQARQQDILLDAVKPSLLGRLALSAVLRSRALAEEPQTQVA